MDAVDLFEGVVDGVLHALCEGVERPLESRQVDQHELVVFPVRDPEDALPRRLWLVGDDRDLAAREGVYERRLPDVRAAGDGDETRLHRSGKVHVSGRSPAALCSAIEPSSRRNATRSKRHSCSHWRQPPHGDALIPIAAKSPGRTPSLAAFEMTVRSAQTPSG